MKRVLMVCFLCAALVVAYAFAACAADAPAGPLEMNKTKQPVKFNHATHAKEGQDRKVLLQDHAWQAPDHPHLRLLPQGRCWRRQREAEADGWLQEVCLSPVSITGVVQGPPSGGPCIFCWFVLLLAKNLEHI